MLEVLGFIFAIIIGLVLGIIGGGGSILTVPVLVYLFSISPVLSTSYSLVIVGITSLIGVFTYFRKKNVSFATGLLFGLPAIFSIYLTRRYFLPYLPDEIFQISNIHITKDVMIMVIFAILMIISAFSMIRNKNDELHSVSFTTGKKVLIILTEGLIVGFLTGIVGAGGGFLIIPALVILLKMPMKLAVGTSLFIIAVKSLIGFAGDIGANIEINWEFLIIFTSISIIGMILGSILSSKFESASLKPIFGWFVLVTGSAIILQNLISIGGF